MVPKPVKGAKGEKFTDETRHVFDMAKTWLPAQVVAIDTGERRCPAGSTPSTGGQFITKTALT
jgi:hypothetical protein